MPAKTTDMAPATDWLVYLVKADILTEALTGKGSLHSKVIKIGNFLGPNINRTVPIQVKGRNGHATLRRKKGAANSKLYYFEVVWDTPAIAEETPTATIVEQQPVVDHSSAVNIAPATESVAVRNPAGNGLNPGNDETWG